MINEQTEDISAVVSGAIIFGENHLIKPTTGATENKHLTYFHHASHLFLPKFCMLGWKLCDYHQNGFETYSLCFTIMFSYIKDSLKLHKLMSLVSHSKILLRSCMRHILLRQSIFGTTQRRVDTKTLQTCLLKMMRMGFGIFREEEKFKRRKTMITVHMVKTRIIR